MNALALIGFMGAGKSHVGMVLADGLRVPFIDTDQLIAEQIGPIEDVFARNGEAYFRRVERDVCVTVLLKSRRTPTVVSLGGGAVMDGDVQAALVQLPHVAWLTAPIHVMFLRAAEGGRPLARDEDAFQELYVAREPTYRRLATAVVSNDGSRTVEDVAAELAALMRS